MASKNNINLYDSCSIQVKLPDEHINQIQEWSIANIPDSVIYTDPTEPLHYGRDLHSHITICFGFKETHLEELTRLIQEEFEQFEISTSGLFHYSNDKFDVIHLRINENPTLISWYKLIHPLSDKNISRSKFNPHITIAFVQKGKAEHLIKKLPYHTREELTFVWENVEIEFVNRKGELIPIQLNGKENY